VTPYTLHQGDCRDVMAGMDADSVDAIVCDPPYGLRFMGKGWDHGVPGVEFWQAAKHVAKPGAHLLAFGGTRTFHRLTAAIEDAGWEIRDTIMWVYGSGFPKSLNIGDGIGTALKPAWEPIIVARKPLAGTVASNVLRYGTGGINIDACRIELSEDDPNHRPTPSLSNRGANSMFGSGGHTGDTLTALGRWPANLIHDGSEDVVGLFPESEGGAFPGNTANASKFNGLTYNGGKEYAGILDTPPRSMGDSGSAARFFYTAKASREDREEGLESLPLRSAGEATDRVDGSAGLNSPRAGASRTNGARNHHPTVKPTSLMRYLCRLVTPRDGVVLDPFMGSGSTGKAAILEGFRFIGIDLEPEYVEIARARCEWAMAQPRQLVLEDAS